MRGDWRDNIKERGRATDQFHQGGHPNLEEMQEIGE